MSNQENNPKYHDLATLEIHKTCKKGLKIVIIWQTLQTPMALQMHILTSEPDIVSEMVSAVSPSFSIFLTSPNTFTSGVNVDKVNVLLILSQIFIYTAL